MEDKELEYMENAVENAKEEEELEIQESEQKELDEKEVKEVEELETQEEPNEKEEVVVPLTPKEIRKAKREERREKRRAALRGKYIEGPDLKFKQPLSYRFLRIFAWTCMFLAQLVVIFNLANTISNAPVFTNGVLTALTTIGALSTPLFLFATFSIILNGSKTYKSMIILYGGAYLGMGLVGVFAYYHYINPLLAVIMGDTTGMDTLIGDLLGQKIQLNVFADLFALTFVSFFINYTPKKFFQGKKIYIFRFMVLIPLLVIALGFTVKILIRIDGISIPFWAYIFLPTKSPIMHMLFLCVALWVKNRKKMFIRIGGTEEQYQTYLKTNRNSIHFSRQLSILTVVFVVIDAILFIFVAAMYYVNLPLEYHNDTGFIRSLANANAVGFGDALALVLLIPVIMLFSYTKTHKNKLIDTLMPVGAIGIIAILYIEGVFQVIYQYLLHAGN